MVLPDIAEWLAPAATMIAAMMTASNLGARVTGWGFVVFTLGSLCWIVVGLESDQTGLIVTNAFLTFVNGIGIWRWLGRQARYEAVGDNAEAEGQAPTARPVLPATGIIGRKVVDGAGKSAGEAVEAIIDSDSAQICRIVMRTGGVGGVGERLVELDMGAISLGDDVIRTSLSCAQIAELPELEAD